MELTITARNLDLTPALRQYVERKLKKLTRYLDHITTAHAILSVEKHRHIVEVTLRVRDLTIRGEEATENLYASVDLVVDKLERQILRYKEKLVTHSSRGEERASPPPVEAPVGGSKVVKVKRFAIKPLSLDEAVMQMDLLGHSFFVFRNAMTEEINVLYRRRDGTYGLIELES